jgi:GNAT superfamily N-acetyltransferase
MHTNLTIRPASTNADWNAAQELLGAYLDWVAANVRDHLADEAWATAHRQLAELRTTFGPPHRLHLARMGRVPVGMLGVQVADGVAELTRFFIRPVARGTGAGRALLRSVLDRLDEGDIHDVVLETVPADMPAAYRLYLDHGFVEAGRSALCPSAVRMRRRQLATAAARRAV